MTVRPAPLEVVAVDAPACALGESPRWAHGAWWWVDAAAGVLWTCGPGLDDVREVVRTGRRMSVAHPAAGGRVLIAQDTDLLVLDPRSGATTPWATVPLPPGHLLNDGSADPAGRFWIGSVDRERRPGAGSLHVVETDGSVRRVAGGITLSNGMVWSGDARLLHADSLARCLWEHEVDPRAGTVARSRRSIELPPGPDADGPALPDGLALDVDGGVWVAMYGTHEAWRLVDGAVRDVVRVPTPQVTSVALGGPDGRDLLVTTAQEDMDAAALAADPAAGRVFHARVRVPGVPVSLYGPTSAPGVTRT
ncbi:hypothetical protein GGQ22_04645 [Nocardioides sp. zg-579]|uniref:SMP-30/Gluconolactonase/LRE-like region domain-containing protein n=1 Tax=Nocardioides marmotae TaxID=2663857 RepID=A0A6I3J5A5_9ACTN|nr:hypothetical protein [Gordonia jinghuaiqii]MTB94364.1 hypothetical protein [Nocardioides marmotae]